MFLIDRVRGGNGVADHHVYSTARHASVIAEVRKCPGEKKMAQILFGTIY